MSIKVLLVNDVEKLGYFGDVVEVAGGYARNYLLPQGMAIIPTEANLKSLEEEKQKRAQKRKTERIQLEEAIAAIENAEAVIAATTNEQGHLFGSVGPSEIAANLREQGLLAEKPSEDKAHLIVFEDGRLRVADDVIKLEEKIKQVGTTQAKVKFADELVANIKVVVVSENYQIASLETEDGEQAESEPTDAESSEQPGEQSQPPADSGEPKKAEEETKTKEQ